ncbi:MAG TPA: hypothetical protein VKE73_15205 [Myxococcota bacterium]|nr:hypothetical protein [Myxococcota bacterium]
MEAAMWDRPSSSLRHTVCAALAGCALIAAGARADDLFGPEPVKPAPQPALMCPAGAHAGVDVQSKIDQIQRMLAAGAPGDSAGGTAVMLNGGGFNYGGPSHEVDPAALRFEARQAR